MNRVASLAAPFTTPFVTITKTNKTPKEDVAVHSENSFIDDTSVYSLDTNPDQNYHYAGSSEEEYDDDEEDAEKENFSDDKTEDGFYETNEEPIESDSDEESDKLDDEESDLSYIDNESDNDEENEEIIKNTEESDAESDNNNEEDTDDESDDENDKIYLHANKQTHNRKRKYHEVTENNENIKNKNKNENENEIKHTVKRSKLTSELINDTCKLLSTLLRTLDLLPCIQNVLKNAIAKGWDLTHITDCLWTHVGDEDIDKLSNRPVLAKYFTMQNFEDLVQKMCPDAVPIFVPLYVMFHPKVTAV